jgi:hypothetical protein
MPDELPVVYRPLGIYPLLVSVLDYSGMRISKTDYRHREPYNSTMPSSEVYAGRQSRMQDFNYDKRSLHKIHYFSYPYNNPFINIL